MPITFPTTRLDVEVSLALGADLTADPGTWSWTEITSYVRYDQGIEISVGLGSESDEASPGTCRLVLHNADGRFSPRLPTGAYYPNIRFNTPLRVRLDPGTGMAERFVGYVDSWAPGWDISGNERRVTVTASGLLRRLAQGETLTSPLYDAITAAAPAAWWPMADGVDADQAASGLAGGSGMSELGALSFASVEGPAGAPEQYPQLLSGSEYTGGLTARLPSLTPGAWTVELWFKAEADGADAQVVLAWWTSTGSYGGTYWLIYVAKIAGAHGLVVVARHSTTDTAFQVLGDPVMDGQWHQVRVSINQVTGSTVDVDVYFDGVLGDFAHGQSGTAGRVVTAVVGDYPGIHAGPFPPETTDSASAAHLAIYTDDTPVDTYDAGAGYPGETAGDRIERVCAEAGIGVTVAAGDTEPMGAQPVGTVLDILRDCERTDGGILYESGAGLAYLPRTARYNRAVDIELDVDARDLAAPPEAVDDDLSLRNDVTATRSGGSSARYVDTDGPMGVAAVGRYSDSVSVNPATDDPLDEIAQWRVHLGAGGGFRYPGVVLNFAARPSLIPAWLAADIGSRATVANPPAELPPGDLDLHELGYVEAIRPTLWTVKLSTVAAQPWSVAVVEGTGAPAEPEWRVDADASTLAAGVDDNDTTLSVATTTGPLWTTAAGDRPFDIDVGGERMTVTGLTGASSPQSFTVTRAVGDVIKSHSSGATVRLWKPPCIAR